jgi:two-component system, LytTR family, sensor kinase
LGFKILAMKKSIVALLHIGFWVCYMLLAIVIMAAIFGNDPNPDEKRMENVFAIILFFGIVPSAISFYLFYFFLFPRYIKPNKILPSISYGILICLLAGIVGFALLTGYTSESKCTIDPTTTAIGVTLFISFVSLISGIIALVIQGFITWLDEIKLKEMLKQKTIETELALVKSQLDPHFLFNTINNIDVLILKDAEVASNYLNKLSDILRFMLYETKSDSIPLAKELEYIEKYVELQKIRTNNIHYVHYTVTGKADNKTIAPMVFIPFIENAFKHTNNKKVENAITISILIKQGEIEFVCENKFSANTKTKEEESGLGNELIQKRLNLIYPEKHTLKVTNQNDLYSVHLTIKNG